MSSQNSKSKHFVHILKFIPLNKPKLIDPPFAFLLFVSGMLAVYAYLLFVWNFASDETENINMEFQLVPESELSLHEISSILNEDSAENGSEEVPKRRFSSNFSPLAAELPSDKANKNVSVEEMDVVKKQELHEKVPHPVPVPENFPTKGAAATSVMPMLNFVGVDSKYRNMELPIGELEALDAFPKSSGTAVASSTPPVVIDDSGTSLHKHFYNLPITGKKVLFLLEAVPGGRGNDEAYALGLENELQRVVDSLDEDVMFNISVFWGEKVSLCNKDFIQANAGNKAYSIIWLKSYFNNDKDGFNEENKPDGYPGMYSSQSGLDWASPLFLAVENRPDSIYLMSSSWKGATKLQSGTTSSLQWTDEKNDAWERALKETQLWIDEENERRVIQGLPPRPIFNIKQIVARRYPDVQVPPALPRLHEDKIYDELKKRFVEFGVMKKCSLFIVVHSGFGRTVAEDMQKFKTLVLPYNGETYLVK